MRLRQRAYRVVAARALGVVALTALNALLSACAAGTLAPAGHASKVVLVSFDALTADTVDRFSAQHAFSQDGFEKMRREGTVVRVVPVTPSQTSATHVSMLTGAPPSRTGVLANNFHHRGAPPSQIAMGFSTPIEVETIADAARRQGKRVGILAFPSFDAADEHRRGDWGLVYTKPVTKGNVLTLTAADWHAATGSSPCRSAFSPAMTTRIAWVVTTRDGGSSIDVDLYACDSTDDGKVDYDETHARIGNDDLPLDDKRWFPVSARLDERGGSRLYGSWSKVLRLDPTLASAAIYLGPISGNEGYPAELTRAIDDAAGFTPGAPDLDSAKLWLAGRAGLDPQSFIEQVDRLAEFNTNSAIAAMKAESFDLLLLYESYVDEAQHQYLITLPEQLYSTDEHRAEGARVIAEAFGAADRGVATLLAALPSQTALLVTGDHGMTPAVWEVHMNRLLVDWGFAKTANGTLADDSPWGAYGSGENMQFYRFGTADDSDALMAKLVTLHGPDGTPVYERVERRATDAHRDAGDLLAYANPRYVVTMALGDPFVKSPTYGQHGGMSDHRELQTMLLAWGAGVPHATGLLPIAQTKLARYIAALLGIDPPNAAE